MVAVLAVSPGWVDQPYVTAAAQGQGVGSRLDRIAQESAPAHLDLWTFQRNVLARGFYERHGFQAVAEPAGDNEENEPDVLYRWTPRGTWA